MSSDEFSFFPGQAKGLLTGAMIAMLVWGGAIFYKTNYGVLVVLVPIPNTENMAI